MIDPKKKEVVLQRIKDRKEPFCAAKPEPEQGRIILPSSTYAENDLGKEILVIVDWNDRKILKRSYRDAATAAAANNLRLPSHVLHDEYLVGTVSSTKLNELKEKDYYPAWAREIIAYPEKDGAFESGRDIVDSETGWTLRANYVPPEAIGVKGVGLFIDPESVTKEGRLATVIPKTIIILRGIIQESGDIGRVDPRTRIPLGVESFDEPPQREMRGFYRISGVGVRPLVRHSDNRNDFAENYAVRAGDQPYAARGVGGVKIQ